MLEVRRTEVYAKWLDGLRDVRARVLVRIERLAAGNPGDVKPVGEGVSEMRIDHGPGYRVYFKRQGHTVSSCCWPAATSARRRATSRRPCAWRETCR